MIPANHLQDAIAYLWRAMLKGHFFETEMIDLLESVEKFRDLNISGLFIVHKMMFYAIYDRYKQQKKNIAYFLQVFD